MRTPLEVAADIVTFMKNNAGSVSYDDLEVRIRKALEGRDREHLSQNLCDLCVGTGRIASGVPCACGGSGRMSDTARFFRGKISVLQKKLDDQAAELERIRGLNDD